MGQRRVTAKKAPKPAWLPPAGLRIDVGVARGDVSFRAEAAVGDALNVARLLVAMIRQIAKDAPDILPHADSVPGAVLPCFEDEWADEARITVGFRPVPPRE